jgi:hypothetical protein
MDDGAVSLTRCLFHTAYVEQTSSCIASLSYIQSKGHLDIKWRPTIQIAFVVIFLSPSCWNGVLVFFHSSFPFSPSWFPFRYYLCLSFLRLFFLTSFSYLFLSSLFPFLCPFLFISLFLPFFLSFRSYSPLLATFLSRVDRLHSQYLTYHRRSSFCVHIVHYNIIVHIITRCPDTCFNKEIAEKC